MKEEKTSATIFLERLCIILGLSTVLLILIAQYSSSVIFGFSIVLSITSAIGLVISLIILVASKIDTES